MEVPEVSGTRLLGLHATNPVKRLSQLYLYTRLINPRGRPLSNSYQLFLDPVGLYVCSPNAIFGVFIDAEILGGRLSA